MFAYYPQRHCSGLSLEDLLSPLQSGYGGHPCYRTQRQQQLRLQREARERQLQAEYLRQLKAYQEQQEAHETALRAERARRLEEAQAYQARQRQHNNNEPGDELVQVQFPDGRRYLVPLSWVRAQQAEPGPQVQQPSPPAALPEPETPVVDGTIEPSTIPTDTETFKVPITTPSEPIDPPRLHATQEEREEAASKLQRFARRQLRLKHLNGIRGRFHAIRDQFTVPALESLVFNDTPTEAGNLVAPKLAFGTPANRKVQEYEETLLKLLMDLDAVQSGGIEEVKKARKGVVREVESELERLDRVKAEAWKVQRGELKEAVVAEVAAMGTGAQADKMSLGEEGEDRMIVEEEDDKMSFRAGDGNASVVEDDTMSIVEEQDTVTVPLDTPSTEASAPLLEAPRSSIEAPIPLSGAATSGRQTATTLVETNTLAPELAAAAAAAEVPTLLSEAPYSVVATSNSFAGTPSLERESPTIEPHRAPADEVSSSTDKLRPTAIDEEFASADEEAWDIVENDGGDRSSEGRVTPELLQKELEEVLRT